MSKIFALPSFAWLAVLLALSSAAFAQDAAAPAKQPMDHVLGAITAVDPSAHTVTVAEDKTGTSYTILLGDTKSFLKVEPGAKDLTNAQRITADDLQVGDRVDARGRKADPPTSLTARGVVLMSARDLQKAHQDQAAAWQKATSGTVSALDAAGGKITVNARTPEGPKPITIETSKATEFTRYAPDSPKTPAPSQLAEIQAGDQLRVIGDKTEDGTSIKAQRVYTGAFRTLSATVTSIGADGKSLVIKDLATKKPIQISLNDDSVIHKLPAEAAARLARRFNPTARTSDGTGTPAGSGGGNATPSTEGGNGNFQRGPGGGGAGRNGGDMSQMLEHLPKIAVAELKAGDALVVSGVALGTDNSKLLAMTLIAGVEPILQSAPQRQNSMASDWGLGEMSVPQ